MVQSYVVLQRVVQGCGNFVFGAKIRGLVINELLWNI